METALGNLEALTAISQANKMTSKSKMDFILKLKEKKLLEEMQLINNNSLE